MDKLVKLGQDMALLWGKYRPMYLNGIKNTLILALAATAIGCFIGLLCGVLNTIPYAKNDPLPKRFLLKLVRVMIRVYVEVFRGTPMVLQAVFIVYGICRKEPVKGQRENHRTQRYDGIAFQLPFQKLLPLIVCLSFMPQRRPTTMRKVHALYSRLICWSSESSSFTKAPAAGIARTR